MKVIKITSIILTVALLTWGCNQSGEKENSGNKQDSKQVQQQTPPLQTPPSGNVDKYGRSPGDQHYGHDHAPANQQPATQLNTPPPILEDGEPDKYGRKPGEAHYGHDHE